jgi:hypothetical protein
MPVAHACNPSYSGGRNQEDRGSKPSWANSLQDCILKIEKKGKKKKDWWSGSRCRALSSNPSTGKKKKKKKERNTVFFKTMDLFYGDNVSLL